MEMHLVCVGETVGDVSSSLHGGRSRGRNEGTNLDTVQETTFIHKATRTFHSTPKIVHFFTSLAILIVVDWR